MPVPGEDDKPFRHIKAGCEGVCLPVMKLAAILKFKVDENACKTLRTMEQESRH